MELHVVTTLREGTFTLLSELSARHLEIVSNNTPVLFDLPPEEGDEEDPLREESSEPRPVLYAPDVDAFGCWWHEDLGCTHERCLCGPVTLLDVLYAASALDRQGILDAHITRVSALWDHFWSGDSVLTGSANSLGSACAQCLIEGHEHLAKLYATAEELATELGTALAAHSFTITLGPPRWP